MYKKAFMVIILSYWDDRSPWGEKFLVALIKNDIKLMVAKPMTSVWVSSLNTDFYPFIYTDFSY